MNGSVMNRGTLGLLLLGMGALIPTPAEACVTPNCMLGVRFPLPENGGPVPANVPGLVTVPPLLERIDPATVRLVREDGTPVPATVTGGAHQTQVVVPNAPLEPGATYRLEAKGDCRFQTTEPQSTTFTVGEARTLPTATGTLTATPPERGTFHVYGDSSCGNTKTEGDSTSLRFTPSPELVPFLPWVHWTVEVDGQTWASVRHDAFLATGEGNGAVYLYDYSRRMMFLYAVCQQPDSGMPVAGLAPGRHTATLRGTLEHANITLPPLSVDFQLSCDSTRPDDDPTNDPGKSNGCSQSTGGMSVLGLLTTLGLWLGQRRKPAR
jgi:hypothetical protein